MRKRYECLATLAQRKAVEIARAVLGDDPVHVTARGDDASTWLQLRGDS